MTVQEYNACVREFSDGLYRFALKNVRDTDLAQDFVQDAFERLWLRLDTVDYQRVKSYLFRTVVNLQIDRSRRQSLQQQHLSSLPDPVHSPGVAHDVQQLIDEGVARLNDIQRTVLTPPRFRRLQLPRNSRNDGAFGRPSQGLHFQSAPFFKTIYW
jgi:RNA polymerase sigma factor (sigma-70 family)